MITQETAGRIWNCYREIAAGEKILADMAEAEKEYDHDKTTATGTNGRLIFASANGRKCDRESGTKQGERRDAERPVPA